MILPQRALGDEGMIKHSIAFYTPKQVSRSDLAASIFDSSTRDSWSAIKLYHFVNVLANLHQDVSMNVLEMM